VGEGERIHVNTLPESLRPRLEVTGAMAYDRATGSVYMGARHVDTHEGSILERNAEGDIRTVTGVWGEGEYVLKDAGSYSDPTDLAVDGAHGRLLSVRWNFEGVLAIDIGTGARTVLSSKDRGVGPRIGFPRSIDVDPAANIAYVASTRGILAVDLETGDRVLLTD
jgi:chloramphenicol 3-O-phosphotransferase